MLVANAQYDAAIIELIRNASTGWVDCDATVDLRPPLHEKPVHLCSSIRCSVDYGTKAWAGAGAGARIGIRGLIDGQHADGLALETELGWAAAD